jgi:tetratricopeptide (TPR) repeat protein
VRSDLEFLSDIEITPLDQPEPEVIYLFKHIITQEVAYESLAYATRAQLHEQFAAFLETQGDERALDLLAYHYGRSDNVPKKREYFRRAGEAAANRFANAEAVEYLSGAIELADDSRERYQLYRLREQVFHLQANREAQVKDIVILESLADGLDDNRQRAEIALRRAVYAKATGNYQEAIAAAQRALALGAAIPEIEAESYLEWGQSHWFLAEYPQAQTQLDQALARTDGLTRLRAYTLRNLAMVAIRQGKLEQAQTYYEQATPLFHSIPDRLGESIALNDLGNIAFFHGDFAAARRHYEQSIQLSREIGDRWGTCSALGNLGAVVADERGDYVTAQTYLREAVALARQIGDPQVEASSLNNLGFYAAALGHYADAQSYYEQALQRVQAVDNRSDEGALLNNLGVVAAVQGDYPTALARYEQALNLRRELEDQVGESETLAYLGLLHHERGEHETGRTYCQQAIPIAQEVGAGLEEARAHNVLGHVLAALGQAEEAANEYRQALEQRRDLGQDHLAIEPLAGLARVALAQGDMAAALGHINDILVHLETRPADGLEEPFRVYLTCYQVLRQANDARARQVIDAAYDLLQARVERTGSAELRRFFLENVPVNRDLIAAWADGQN